MINLPTRLLPLAALLFSTTAPAQQAPLPQPAPAPAPAATVDADPALWVVKDKDTTIYLFGTIHVLKPGLAWFDEAVKDAFDQSQELRLEMVMPDTKTAQAEALKLATLPEGQTLPAKLTEPARAKLAATLTQYKIPPATFDRYTPWFTATNLSVLPLMGLGYKLDAGAEQVLTRAANDSAKPISGFETFPEQMGFFAGLSEPAQVAYLTSVLDDLPKFGTMVDAMVGDWRKGDPAALAKLLNDDLNANRELADKLLYQRNARWADWIKTRMAQPGTVFVAVGAGHLAGKQSVQDLLKKRGLKVRRVKY